ncbi:hypothetical protein HOF78_03875 [Candidatus Woesearchaeota archaeon]|jgi:hypothetical protein|nr:hypothetical protein [Candidatus Woesearchaeota archaeon]MBT6044718.1 hypothetical protein [Candidatus Woesearchaeota archaeon]
MIIGFNFKKLNIERKKPLIKGMKVAYNLDISNVQDEVFPLADKGQGVLTFDFDYSVVYNPDIAEIKMHGSINYLLPKDEAKKVLTLWSKTKKLPKNVSIPVINRILDKCNIKAMELEQDLSLPTHLPMPSVDVSGTKKDKDSDKHVG